VSGRNPSPLIAGFRGGRFEAPLPSPSVGFAFTKAVSDTVSHFPLVDQTGRSVSLSTWKGQEIFIVPFLALCQDTCPFTSGNVLQLESQLGAHRKNVRIVLFDVDPYRDTPARLAAYSKLIGTNKYSNLSYVTYANSAAPD
jgi:cytochrome oxidase Cu insertion factor (SCO1/SenC/PrrC family)